MLTRNFLRGRRGWQIGLAEHQALETGFAAPVHLPPRHVLVEAGSRITHSTLLVSGMIGRYMGDSRGRRQLVSLQVPGEFVDLHGYPLQRLDHSVETLTSVTVAAMHHDRLTNLIEAHPHLARILWFSTLLDAAMHRDWIFRLGRLDAEERVAYFFCETSLRLAKLGLGDGRRFRLPLNQTDIGEACGLTNVHVSRVLASLRARGLMHYTDGVAELADPAALAAFASFTPDYLYFDDLQTIP